MLKNCYLCGKPADNPLELKDSFTGHSLAKCPSSQFLCDRCYAPINGDEKQLWYWSDEKGKWSKLWGRSLTRLYIGNKLKSPIIEGKREGLKIVSNLAKRVEIREWLINPPTPPFTIAIAESGQKHILPWAIESQNRDYFPVQFEMDTVWIDLPNFCTHLENYENLIHLGFSKTEINSGNYKSDRIMKAWGKFEKLEDAITLIRGTRLIELIAYVAVSSQNNQSISS